MTGVLVNSSQVIRKRILKPFSSENKLNKTIKKIKFKEVSDNKDLDTGNIKEDIKKSNTQFEKNITEENFSSTKIDHKVIKSTALCEKLTHEVDYLNRSIKEMVITFKEKSRNLEAKIRTQKSHSDTVSINITRIKNQLKNLEEISETRYLESMTLQIDFDDIINSQQNCVKNDVFIQKALNYEPILYQLDSLSDKQEIINKKINDELKQKNILFQKKEDLLIELKNIHTNKRENIRCQYLTDNQLESCIKKYRVLKQTCEKLESKVADTTKIEDSKFCMSWDKKRLPNESSKESCKKKLKLIQIKSDMNTTFYKIQDRRKKLLTLKHEYQSVLINKKSNEAKLESATYIYEEFQNQRKFVLNEISCEGVLQKKQEALLELRQEDGSFVAGEIKKNERLGLLAKLYTNEDDYFQSN